MNIHTGKITEFKTINYVNNKYVISWGLEQINDDTYRWKYFIMNTKPSVDEIKATIETYINDNTKHIIETSFYWNNMNIYLSLENQIDYKLLFDITMIKEGSNLPEKLKFKINGEKIYYDIDTIDEFKDFMISMNNHIRVCLDKGNNLKDSINYEEYKI